MGGLGLSNPGHHTNQSWVGFDRRHDLPDLVIADFIPVKSSLSLWLNLRWHKGLLTALRQLDSQRSVQPSALLSCT